MNIYFCPKRFGIFFENHRTLANAPLPTHTVSHTPLLTHTVSHTPLLTHTVAHTPLLTLSRKLTNNKNNTELIYDNPILYSWTKLLATLVGIQITKQTNLVFCPALTNLALDLHVNLCMFVSCVSGFFSRLLIGRNTRI